jgi:hypothetical protein
MKNSEIDTYFSRIMFIEANGHSKKLAFDHSAEVLLSVQRGLM